MTFQLQQHLAPTHHFLAKEKGVREKEDRQETLELQ